MSRTSDEISTRRNLRRRRREPIHDISDDEDDEIHSPIKTRRSSRLHAEEIPKINTLRRSRRSARDQSYRDYSDDSDEEFRNLITLEDQTFSSSSSEVMSETTDTQEQDVKQAGKSEEPSSVFTIEFPDVTSTASQSVDASSQPTSSDGFVNNNPTPQSTLFQIMTDPRFTDAVLIVSKREEIPTHRYFLSQASNVFADIIQVSDKPCHIIIDGFNKDTVSSALNYLYGKHDSIVGKETTVFEFAVKYEISELMTACCSKMENSVTPANVCDVIRVAYSNNLESLKTKCLKMVIEKKEEIDDEKLDALPKNIFKDALSLCKLK